ncbi:hypothetical protein BU26DRAFT_520381 [Trematosphaeria pertusa]|uniref:Uncharacterized protein n=1 Tax=Trematosphaeria pertusa TaxID=390896 RepID=A0A6A6I964_9PLEO|nr:uncharacterized protein BU26DRAFT_520381 [Trematosphaeria pertusa]KAF2247114.1 hypothetical protein BU26DRAFT_520381 [Trematosphaeria pertusa]
MEARPFRFLDLPTEVRLIVYEYLPIKTRHRQLGPKGEDFSFLKLITKSIPGISILATCGQIHAEALPILEPRISTLRKEPVRILSDFCMPDESGLKGILQCLTYDEASCSGNAEVFEALQRPGGDIRTHEELHEILQASIRDIAPGRHVQVSLAACLDLGYVTEREKPMLFAMWYSELWRWARNKTEIWDEETGRCHTNEKRHRKVSVSVRPCLTSTALQQALEMERRWDSGVGPPRVGRTIVVDEKEGIKPVEWEDDWEEGEKV